MPPRKKAVNVPKRSPNSHPTQPPRLMPVKMQSFIATTIKAWRAPLSGRYVFLKNFLRSTWPIAFHCRVSSPFFGSRALILFFHRTATAHAGMDFMVP